MLASLGLVTINAVMMSNVRMVGNTEVSQRYFRVAGNATTSLPICRLLRTNSASMRALDLALIELPQRDVRAVPSFESVAMTCTGSEIS
jgi:hypothetical protein